MDPARRWQVASVVTAAASIGLGAFALQRPSSAEVDPIDLDVIATQPLGTFDRPPLPSSADALIVTPDLRDRMPTAPSAGSTTSPANAVSATSTASPADPAPSPSTASPAAPASAASVSSPDGAAPASVPASRPSHQADSRARADNAPTTAGPANDASPASPASPASAASAASTESVDD